MRIIVYNYSYFFRSTTEVTSPLTTAAQTTLAPITTEQGMNIITCLSYTAPHLACGVDVTMKFLAYTGGVYSEKKLDIGINHEISVTGWGYDEESQKEYWIGRNSWGTYWGEYGFFRIEMHKNNLGIETSCFWATPKI